MPGLRTDYGAGQDVSLIEPVAKDELFCYVNGKRRVLPYGRAEVTLLQWLRGTLLHRNLARKLEAIRCQREREPSSWSSSVHNTLRKLIVVRLATAASSTKTPGPAPVRESRQDWWLDILSQIALQDLATSSVLLCPKSTTHPSDLLLQLTGSPATPMVCCHHAASIMQLIMSSTCADRLPRLRHDWCLCRDWADRH